MKCNHVMENGQPCGAEAVRHRPYCYQHRNNYNSPDLPGDPNYRAPQLTSYEAVLAAANHLYQSFMSKKLDLRQTSLASKILKQAAHALDAIARRDRPTADPRLPKALASLVSATPKPAAVAPFAGTTPAGTDVPPAATPASRGERIWDPYGCLAPLKA